MPKPVVLTNHAQQGMRLRGVLERWVTETALTPEWSAPEPRHLGAVRRFRSVPEFGGRCLRWSASKRTTPFVL
jgi:hypothetical protein